MPSSGFDHIQKIRDTRELNLNDIDGNSEKLTIVCPLT